MTARPHSVLQFAVSAPSAQLVEPPAEIRNNGFATGTRPPAQWLNYLMGNVAQWIDRLRGPSRASWTRQTIGVNFVAAAVDTLTNDSLFANPARRVVAITDGGSNTVQASVRGDSWVGLTVEPSDSIAALACICTTNDGWFLGGENFAGTSGVICATLFDPDNTSAIKNDANNWTLHTLPASTLVVNAIACRKTGPSAGDAAAITAAKIIFRSGPTTWANATLSTAVSGTVLDVHDTGAAWLAVTSSGQVYRTSTPSGSWAIVTTLPATNKWRFASDGLGRVVAYRREDGGSADWYVSTDHGLTWGVIAAPFEVANARRVRFVDGTWFCCSSDFPYLSESNDLVKWNRIPVPIIDGVNHRIDDVLAIDEGLVAIGQGFWLLSARGEAVAPGPWSPGPARLPIADAGYLQGRAIDSTAPSNGQTLVWDAGLSKWKPGAGGGGGLPAGALGSTLVHDGTSYVSYGVGTAGQVLRVVSGTAQWSTLTAADVGAIAAPGSPADGAVLARVGGAWTASAAGTARQPLTSAGTGAPAWGVDVLPLTQRAIDGVSSAVSVCATIAHDLSTGGGAAGIGARCVLQARNAASALTDAAAVDGVLTTSTAGSEVGALDLYVRSGGALVRFARFAPGGNTLGVTTSVTQYQGGARVPERTVSTSTTLAAQDEVVFVVTSGGAVTLTLPTGASGRVLAIQRVAGTADVIVQRAGSPDTIRAGGSSGLTSWTISDSARHGLIYRSSASEWVAEA